MILKQKGLISDENKKKDLIQKFTINIENLEKMNYNINELELEINNIIYSIYNINKYEKDLIEKDLKEC